MILPSKCDLDHEVIYTGPDGKIRVGLIKSFNERYTFVRFRGDTVPTPVRHSDLKWSDSKPVPGSRRYKKYGLS